DEEEFDDAGSRELFGRNFRCGEEDRGELSGRGEDLFSGDEEAAVVSASRDRLRRCEGAARAFLRVAGGIHATCAIVDGDGLSLLAGGARCGFVRTFGEERE